MKKFILVSVLCALCFVGCSAGTSAELLAFDNIEAAVDEAKKGVIAYDDSAKKSLVKLRANFITAVKSDIIKIALSNDETLENAKALADKIGENLVKALDDFATQNTRRADLFNITMDNLDYAKQLCGQGRDFTIYKADVSEQWKSYLNAQARARLGKVDTDAD